MSKNYIVTHREVLVTRYRVDNVIDEDDAADCVRCGIEEHITKIDTDIEPMPEGEDDFSFKGVPA